MDRRGCDGLTKDGRPCRSFGLESGRCVMHDPSRAEAMTAARSRGAVKAAKLRSIEGKRPRLDNARALTRFVSDVVQDTLSGRVLPDVARAVLYGCSIQRQLIETGDLAKRLEALEAQLPTTGAQRRVGGQW